MSENEKDFDKMDNAEGVEASGVEIDGVAGGSAGLYYDMVCCGHCGAKKFVFYPATQTICDACNATITVQWD